MTGRAFHAAAIGAQAPDHIRYETIVAVLVADLLRPVIVHRADHAVYRHGIVRQNPRSDLDVHAHTAVLTQDDIRRICFSDFPE